MLQFARRLAEKTAPKGLLGASFFQNFRGKSTATATSAATRGAILRSSGPRRFLFTNYEAPGANQGGYQQHAYFSQPMYNLLSSKIYIYWVVVFGVGANMTFLPMHFLGFNTMPRRYNESADACQGWNIMCTQGSLIAVLGVWYLKRY
ncbi:unnamed protein product [Amoebophrya sp. A120]|nr:unnamed protein product [Amoebophrya sp. A120]|eukprot:GSA120T00004437001.1